MQNTVTVLNVSDILAARLETTYGQGKATGAIFFEILIEMM